MTVTKETEFKNWLITKDPSLNKDRIIRRSGERPTHLRFNSGCGLSNLYELISLLEKHKISCKNATWKKFSGSPDYGDQGLIIDWGNYEIGLQLAIQKPGRIARKELCPKNLGLSGYRSSSLREFKQKINKGLKEHEHKTCLISMLDNIENGTPIIEFKNINPKDANRITSDFGEILSAYHSVKSGKKIYFPDAGNNNIADYYENDQSISAKGRSTGGKINLTSWKNFIDIKTDCGKFFKAIADHDKSDFFKYAAKLCLEVDNIARWTDGTSEDDVLKFINNVSFKEFYNYIDSKPEHKGLGIPNLKKDDRAKKLWNNENSNPFYFTINTLVNRLWGWNNTKDISEIVTKFLKEPKFVTVDIINDDIAIKKIKFSDVKQWKTVYWGRATKAFHNWMGVEPIKGIL